MNNLLKEEVKNLQLRLAVSFLERKIMCMVSREVDISEIDEETFYTFEQFGVENIVFDSFIFNECSPRVQESIVNELHKFRKFYVKNHNEDPLEKSKVFRNMLVVVNN